jgi:hypothetical protein
MKSRRSRGASAVNASACHYRQCRRPLPDIADARSRNTAAIASLQAASRRNAAQPDLMTTALGRPLNDLETVNLLPRRLRKCRREPLARPASEAAISGSAAIIKHC